MGYVDVRDVAEAHLKAIKVDAAKNKRFILSAEDLWQREYAALIAEEFTSQGFNVTTQEAAAGVDHVDRASNNAAKQVLGINFKPVKQTAVDMINSMIKNGMIQKPE